MSFALHEFIRSIDLAALSLAVRVHTPVLSGIMLGFTHLADPLVIISLQLVVLIVLFVVHRERLAVLFTATLIAGEAVSFFLKDLIARSRPAFLFPGITAVGYSFPSSHALVGTVFYGFSGYLLASATKKKIPRRIIYVVTWLVIFGIGLSRILLGVHWFSDVIGGWLIGGIILYVLICFQKTALHWMKRESHSRRKLVMGVCILAVLVIVFATAYVAVRDTAEFRSILFT